MIVVEVKLWSARTNEVKTISTMVICNDGTSDCERIGSYDVYVGRRSTGAKLSDFRSRIHRTWLNPSRKARVENYPRRAYAVWNLVGRAIRAAGYTEGVGK